MYKSLSKNYKNYKILPKELLFSINFISIKSNNTAEDLSRLIRDVLKLLKTKLPWINNILADAGFCSQVQTLFDDDFKNNLLNNKKQLNIKRKKYKNIKNIFKNKIIKGFANNISVAIIRSFRNGKPFYIITNYNVKDIGIHLKAHSRKWKTETIFRTCKQYLGLSNCQCSSKHKQNNYISFIFLTYLLIQILRKKKRLKNPEFLINRLKFKNLQYIFSELYSVYQLVHQF